MAGHFALGVCEMFSIFVALLDLLHESDVVLAEGVDDGGQFGGALLWGKLVAGGKDTLWGAAGMHVSLIVFNMNG